MAMPIAVVTAMAVAMARATATATAPATATAKAMRVAVPQLELRFKPESRLGDHEQGYNFRHITSGTIFTTCANEEAIGLAGHMKGVHIALWLRAAPGL